MRLPKNTSPTTSTTKHIHDIMNSVCTRCSMRLQRAAQADLRSASTRAFSTAPLRQRGE